MNLDVTGQTYHLRSVYNIEGVNPMPEATSVVAPSGVTQSTTNTSQWQSTYTPPTYQTPYTPPTYQTPYTPPKVTVSGGSGSSSYQSTAIVREGKIVGGTTPSIEGVTKQPQTIATSGFQSIANISDGRVVGGYTPQIQGEGLTSRATSGFYGLAAPPSAQPSPAVVVPPPSAYQISGSAPRELKEQQIMSDLIRGRYVGLEQKQVSKSKFVGYEETGKLTQQGTPITRAKYEGGEVSTKLTPVLPEKTLDALIQTKLGDTSASYKEVAAKFTTATEPVATKEEFKYDTETMTSRYVSTTGSEKLPLKITSDYVKKVPEVAIATKPLMNVLGLPETMMPAGAKLTNKQLSYSITGAPTTTSVVTPTEGGYQTTTTTSTPIETTTIKFVEPATGKGFMAKVSEGYKAREEKAISEASISALPYIVGYATALPTTSVEIENPILSSPIAKFVAAPKSSSPIMQEIEKAIKPQYPTITQSDIEKAKVKGEEISRQAASSVKVTKKAWYGVTSDIFGKGQVADITATVATHAEIAVATGFDVMGVAGAYKFVGGGAVSLGKQVLSGEASTVAKTIISGTKTASDIVGSSTRLVTGFIPERFLAEKAVGNIVSKEIIQTRVGQVALASLVVPSEIPVVGGYAEGGRQAVKEYTQYLTFTGSPSERTGWIVATTVGNIPYTATSIVGAGGVLVGGKIGTKVASIAEKGFKLLNVGAGALMTGQALEATATSQGGIKTYHPVRALGYFQWQFATQEALHEPLSYDIVSARVLEPTIGKAIASRAVSKEIPVAERKFITEDYTKYWSKISPEFKERYIGVTPRATATITPSAKMPEIATVVSPKVTITQTITPTVKQKDITFTPTSTTKITAAKTPTYKFMDISITPSTTRITDTTVSRDITSITERQDTSITEKTPATMKTPTVDIGNWGNLAVPPFAMFPDSGAKGAGAAGMKGSVKGSIVSMLEVAGRLRRR